MVDIILEEDIDLVVGISLEEDTGLEVVASDRTALVVVGILEVDLEVGIGLVGTGLVVDLDNLVEVLVVDTIVVVLLDIPMVVLDSLVVDPEVDIVKDSPVVAVDTAVAIEQHRRPVAVLASGLVEQRLGLRLPMLVVGP